MTFLLETVLGSAVAAVVTAADAEQEQRDGGDAEVVQSKKSGT